jgi:hypothetical protein
MKRRGCSFRRRTWPVLRAPVERWRPTRSYGDVSGGMPAAWWPLATTPRLPSLRHDASSRGRLNETPEAIDDLLRGLGHTPISGAAFVESFRPASEPERKALRQDHKRDKHPGLTRKEMLPRAYVFLQELRKQYPPRFLIKSIHDSESFTFPRRLELCRPRHSSRRSTIRCGLCLVEPDSDRAAEEALATGVSGEAVSGEHRQVLSSEARYRSRIALAARFSTTRTGRETQYGFSVAPLKPAAT